MKKIQVFNEYFVTICVPFVPHCYLIKSFTTFPAIIKPATEGTKLMLAGDEVLETFWGTSFE